MECDYGEVEDGEFLDEAGIKVATPRCNGIEAERAVFDHAGGKGGGLGVAMALCDWRLCMEKQKQRKNA